MAIGCLPFFVMLTMLAVAYLAFGLWGLVWFACVAFILIFFRGAS